MTPIRLVNDTPFPVWDLWRDGVTQSILTKFAMCPEKLRLAEIEGLRSSGQSKKAMDFGSVFHEMEATVWGTVQANNVRFNTNDAIQLSEVCLASLEKKARSEPGANWDDIAETHGLVRATMIGYWMYWEADFRSATFEMIEEPWRTFYRTEERLGIDAPNIPIQGKFDRVYRTPQHRLWLWETKTKGQINISQIIDKMKLDLQLLMYLTAIQELYGEIPEGVRYNIVRRTALKQGKAQSLKDYCARVEADVQANRDYHFPRVDVTFTGEDLTNFRAEFDARMRRIVEWSLDMEHRNFRDSGACTAFFGTCEYLPICANGNTTGYKRREMVMPELEV